MWSSEMSVTTETSGSTTFVASSRPPIPTSSTAISTPHSAKYRNASAVSISKKLGICGSFRSLTIWSAVSETRKNSRAKSPSAISSRPTRIRFRQNRSQSRRRRSFPIRPRNQHCGKPPLRIAQRAEQNPHFIEREFPPRLPRLRIQFRRHRIQLFDCRRVGHGNLQYRSGRSAAAPRRTGRALILHECVTLAHFESHGINSTPRIFQFGDSSRLLVPSFPALFSSPLAAPRGRSPAHQPFHVSLPAAAPTAPRSP